jgi:acyl-CoA synthetase (AMP-forming)/AMP-acid ligase II
MNGDRPAIVSGSGACLITHCELAARADELAWALAPTVRPGSVLSCVLPNSVAFAVTALAAWTLGAVLAPVSHRAPEVERSRLLTRLQPRVVVGTGAFALPPSVEFRVVWADAASPRFSALEWMRSAAPAEGPEPAPRPGDALILFTSGSTAAPKGVILTRRNVECGVESVVSTYRLMPGDRTVALLPWTHGHGLIGVLLSTLRSGGSLAIAPAAAAPRVPDATWISVVPPLLSPLLDAAREAPRPGWRFIRTASAPLGRRLAAEAEAAFGCPVAEAYGMTETAHQAAANPPAFAERRIGSVGRAGPNAVRLGARAVGGGRELEVSGPSVFRGYLHNPEATRAALHGGWYRTQDIGVIDGGGRVWLLGRLSEHINRGGSKVSPVEVEEALGEHPDVAACLVTAIPEAVLGEEIGALVRARPGSALTVEDLARHCEGRLAPYKRPRLIRLTDEIPCAENGKPSRRLAREWLARTDGSCPPA